MFETIMIGLIVVSAFLWISVSLHRTLRGKNHCQCCGNKDCCTSLDRMKGDGAEDINPPTQESG
jgi:hypothetical protein